ncbi:MAG: PPi-type phosphoenolpyruvate carboxykinase [Elusimicrobia bacterium]|nr:PPi-type phosphoenolpyruvate carboxykinase [Elusimicrobiota bacterium]
MNGTQPLDEEGLIQYINLKLAALGQPLFGGSKDPRLVQLATPFLRNHQEKNRLLLNYAPPVDRRIQDFLNDFCRDLSPQVTFKLPSAFILDGPGLARTMSLPPDKDIFESDIVKTYRVKQGILHNPKNDRRTTQGVFHIAEGGLPIPEDKLAVPKVVFANLLTHALRPPNELLRIPFTASQEKKAELFVSLLLRPIVCPASGPGTREKRMEVRFFAPGNLVGNLDFVETIFGNAGDPFLPENDAALDVDGWTGHTGCVILAPHLTKLTKKELGLPSIDKATERQRRDGMCWEKETDLYNNGNEFKITCRDMRGVMVTLIADNYFGYCKKEVKTQISFSANLFGLCEEEHSGGAIAFPSYILGRDFVADPNFTQNKRTFAEAMALLKERVDVKPDGYAIDKQHPNIIYVSENTQFNLRQRILSWNANGGPKKRKLLASEIYILPSGYKVHMERQIGGHYWRLVGTVAEGTLCHKPCTVSGGGKSEISKSIAYSMLQGPVFVRDFKKDFNEVEEIIKKDFTHRFKTPPADYRHRPILSLERSLGSVVKLFTPSPEFTDEYNAWLISIPQTIRQLIFVLKRYYKPEWGEDWREHFSVDSINGFPGHELKYDNQKLIANYLRVGKDKDGSWRIYKVRPDFNPAEKVQMEDDITASVVVPCEVLNDLYPTENPSVKLVTNCESYLFQRPDDAKVRGYDKQAEMDLSEPNTFLSNWQPLTRPEVTDMVENIIDFEDYSDPMKNLLTSFLQDPKPRYVVSSANARLMDGKRSKNPRYLQKRPDQVNVLGPYLAEVGVRLSRGIPLDRSVFFPVNSVLAGRRNNPPDLQAGIPPLAVYNPIHFQELPELFMDFTSSLTGKSPSTTGFGSEGALTKGPFNALWPVVDLNNALVSFILTGYAGFTTAAGHVGPNIQVDHDISLLIPEIWSRMKVSEREPEFLIKNGFLEKIEDFDHKGRKILGSRLGYRITTRFVDLFLGRLFENPNTVFSEEMLKPEKQDLDMFVAGIEEIVATQKRVAESYFKDGSVEAACPPLKAVLHIMARGAFEGKDINHPDIRNLFKRETLLKSDWYRERLETKQARDISLWTNQIAYIEDFKTHPGNTEAVTLLNLNSRLALAKQKLVEANQDAYLKKLMGTLGADPFHKQLKDFS